MKLMPHMSVSVRTRKFLRRSAILAGGITVVCVLVYFATWLFLGDQMVALKTAATLLCILLALVVVGLTLGELTRE